MIELRWRVLAHPAASPQLQYRLAVAVDASGAFCPGEPGEWKDVETAVCPAPHAPAEAAPSPAPGAASQEVQNAAWRKWADAGTVASLIGYLTTLDQGAPIVTAYHVTMGNGERRCKTRSLTISRERVDHATATIRTGDTSLPYTHVLWAQPPEETEAPAVAHSAQQEARAGIHDGLRMALSVVELHGMGGDVIAERIKELIAGCAHPACAMCRGVGSYGEPPKRCEFCALSAISHVPVQPMGDGNA